MYVPIVYFRLLSISAFYSSHYATYLVCNSTYKFYLNKIGPKISESFLIRDLEMNSTLRNAAFGTDSDETVI